MLDDPGRVRSQIINVVCQIQRFDFDCNLVVAQKLIIRVPPGLGLNPLVGKVVSTCQIFFTAVYTAVLEYCTYGRRQRNFFKNYILAM
jgi:hypothetical protein